LRCRECGREYDVAPVFTCEWCFGPLEVAYDYDAIRANTSRDKIAAGPLSIWRYADLLPSDRNPAVDLGAGFTPLVRADRLAAELGLGEVWVKNDTVNPTNSFKDRVTTVALSKALEFGFKVAACASTGNLANSVAAHAAHAGLRSFVFIPANLEQGKIVTTAVYGGNVVAIDGNYDAVNRLCAELAGMYPWAFVNVNVRTFYAEGSKTLAFETAEQLGWEAPDELFKVGLLDDEPKIKVSGAQAEGCSPVARAWLDGADTIKPVKPDTIAKSLAIGNPADGYFALDAVRQSGGGLAAVTDDEIVDAMKLLARTEGIFAETAGGVTVATLKRLAAEGIVRPDERVVVYITGHGLKTLDAVVPTVGPTAIIPPTLDAFHDAFPPETMQE
jgi:threonine synthase